MRLKSDPKNSTLPRAKSHNSSCLIVNVNFVVLRNVNDVFYAKMRSKWVEGAGLTNTNPLQKVSNWRILPISCVHSNKVEPTNMPYQVRSALYLRWSRYSENAELGCLRRKENNVPLGDKHINFTETSASRLPFFVSSAVRQVSYIS